MNRRFVCLLPILLMPVLAIAIHQYGSEEEVYNPEDPAIPSMPMPYDPHDPIEMHWANKKVYESRLLDDMESLDNWEHHGFGEMTLVEDSDGQGNHSLRLTSPTLGDKPGGELGRPFGQASVLRRFDHEDWTKFNRLTLDVSIDCPGFRVASFLMILHNDGETKVPDEYNRDGLNFVLSEGAMYGFGMGPVWEIAHLARDKVTGVELVYRLQGNEPGAATTIRFDFDNLTLERVDADPFEGWDIASGEIAYSHSGYDSHFSKSALAKDLDAKTFRLKASGEDRVALEKPIEIRDTPLGRFQVMEFDEVEPGWYSLSAGKYHTIQPFWVGDNVWRSSIVKTINFFYCERCGFAVPETHDVCHRDWMAEHNGRKILINGGWHDAGDLSQGLVNTSEAVYSMFELAETLGASDPELFDRLVEEANWGLDWVLKGRFGDGYRVTWGTMDFWTDGILGNVDDVTAQVRNSPFDNFTAASAEAIAACVIKKSDFSDAVYNGPIDNPDNLEGVDLELYQESILTKLTRNFDFVRADYAEKCARDDWRFAMERIKEPNLELAAAGAQASIELYKLTHEDVYSAQAFAFAQIILDCQQREYPDWDTPLTGFFYTDTKKDRILHYSHRGHEQAPVVALSRLCELFPDHPDWIRWYSAVVLYSEYRRSVLKYTDPYGMMPASIYHEDESDNPKFREQVQNGVPLGKGYYLRRFPVWFDFRGNHGTGLSQAKALSSAALLREDWGLMDAANRYLQWIVGRNPFCQSTMWGEGHNYAPQYTAMSGNMVGSLPVGFQTHFNRDAPYWPADNCYNYKEVWVHPSLRWLSVLSDLYRWKQESKVSEESPAIQVTGKGMSVGADSSVTFFVEASGEGDCTFRFKALNMDVENRDQKVTLPGKVTWKPIARNPSEPWFVVIVPVEDPSQKVEFSSINN